MTFSTKALIALSTTVVAVAAIYGYTSRKERREMADRQKRARAAQNRSVSKTG